MKDRVQIISILVALVSIVLYIFLNGTPENSWVFVKKLCIFLFVNGILINAAIEFYRFFKKRW